MTTVLGEDIVTLDGQVFSSSVLKRSGNMLMITIPGPSGSGTVEMGLPMARIAKVNFAEPAELADVVAAAAKGNAGQVLTLTASFVNKQADFRDLPGSWWLKMAQLRLFALAGAGKNVECAELARQIDLLKEPEAKLLYTAGILFRSLADSKIKAVELGVQALPRLGGDESSALAQLALGKALFFKKDYVASLKAFLTIKVFYPSATLLQPSALMGAGNCLIALKDEKHARQEFNELIDNWPDSIEVPEAKNKADAISKN